ncbi:hypothetical protein F2P44_17335 [Massilia sp. CCM 8695]|uniref:Uncharacterized protein n=1 Tax=Massilia frigida TaxID=2609281 RepID=A0ABX0NG00_9BURK|nr:hypothetical protein [Massilia frigida]NHZ81023.1 hypothetical protein [Massilia frigida]
MAYALWLVPGWALEYAALHGSVDNATWLLIGVAALLAGAGWVRHRWARMVAPPPAFPGGRMA